MKKPRKYTLKKFDCPSYIVEALAAMKPPDDLTVSEWAAQYRILDELSSKMIGPWKNTVTPYLVGIMDEFNSWECEEVIFVKPTQVGGTEAIFNMMGYAIQQDPAPMMVVYPSDRLACTTCESRIMPMINACASLKRRYNLKGSSQDELKFDNMRIKLTGANSPANLASTPIRYLFLDEVDKYPSASKKEADPISLAKERTKSYSSNRKIYMCSTPTIETGQIWQAMKNADIERHFFVPCPHCGEYIELQFKQVQWPKKSEMDIPELDRAEYARYICQECGKEITDADKTIMLQRGQWRDVRKSAQFHRSVAFWMNTLYSPFTRFADIAKEFIKSKNDTEKLQNFTNSWLAEPWVDMKLKTDSALVLKHQTNLPAGQVPDWAKFLTAGVDVQESCLYWTIRAWGDYITSQNIAHGQVLSFSDVSRIMDMQFMRADGTPFVVNMCLMDSGDRTDEVYDFCAMHSEWCYPCKGTDTKLTHYSISKVNRADSKAYGMQLVLVDGGKYKDMIAGRLHRPSGQGSWMVHKDCDLEYAEQVTAEHKIIEKKNGRDIARWVPKTTHADNHYLDCEVYAMAAADIMGVRMLAVEDMAQPAENPVDDINLKNIQQQDDDLFGDFWQ